jgi:hypothetical protein
MDTAGAIFVLFSYYHFVLGTDFPLTYDNHVNFNINATGGVEEYPKRVIDEPCKLTKVFILSDSFF